MSGYPDRSPLVPLGLLDPGEQDRPPAASREGLGPVGRRTQQDEVVGRAPAAQPEATRGPHVVELEGSETEMGDPETAEDAAPVPGPDMDPHGRGDRVRPRRAPLPGDRIAAEHGRTDEEGVGLGPPPRWRTSASRVPSTCPSSRRLASTSRRRRWSTLAITRCSLEPSRCDPQLTTRRTPPCLRRRPRRPWATPGLSWLRVAR